MKINKDFFKNFKKNDIVIYAIALMLVTAGYFNYTANIEDGVIETSSEETYLENISETSSSESDTDENIGDARLVSSNDVVIEESEVASIEENTSNEENEKEMEDEKDDSSDYFVASRLERDTNFASMISTYTQIIEDSSVSETQKSIAMKEITEINDTKNAIAICENLLSTKGFTNSVIFINNDSVNVVVETDGGLSTDKVAQIQNIVSRELGAEIENIHITENMEE